MVYEAREYLEQTKAVVNAIKLNIVDAYRRAGTLIADSERAESEALNENADNAVALFVDAVKDGIQAEMSIQI